MSRSVARRVAAVGAGVLIVTLITVGLVTAALLHSQQTAALDRALLAAAHGRAHPEVAELVEVEHSRSPVEVWLVGEGDPRVPAADVRAALHDERPRYTDVGDARVVLLPFEVEEGGVERYRVAAAAAPRVTLARSVGPFALVYTLVALLAAAAATLVLRRLVRRAFVPLVKARDEATRVVALGEGLRLTVAGPAEVRGLIAAVNDLLERLEHAHHAQARFTAEAAHELRTPVTTMLGELDVALRSGGQGGQDEVLRSIREEVDRLRRLVDGLTALARIDAGQTERGREPVRAAELAAGALRAERAELAAAGCPVELVVDADPELDAHRSLAEAALGNLLRNAARHAPGEPVILRVGRDGALAVFDVDDRGPGLPRAQREAVFDRFTRAGSARRDDRQGLGLGLPIAREVARRHGGDCVLEDAPDGGLRARLTLRAAG